MGDEEEKIMMMTMEDLKALPPDKIIYVPERIPVRMVPIFRRGSSSTTTTYSKEEEVDLFTETKEKVLKNPVFERPVDCCWRKIMRFNFQAMILQFGSHPSLLRKNVVLLQVVLTDENRCIQEKMFHCPPTVEADDPDVAKRSREMFRAASPGMLHDTKHWVFSRSLVFKDYNGMIDKALKFISHDPIGGLDVIKDLPIVMSRNPSQFEVDCFFQQLTIEAIEKFRTIPEIPLGIRCAEIFMLLAGDFAVSDGGSNSRDAVQKLLHELNTEEGIRKIHGCFVQCGSSKTSPENLAALKDVHLTA